MGVLCERCKKRNGIVGFGEPERWVCQPCFNELLRAVRALVERIFKHESNRAVPSGIS
jgi:hypothetical protein